MTLISWLVELVRKLIAAIFGNARVKTNEAVVSSVHQAQPPAAAESELESTTPTESLAPLDYLLDHSKLEQLAFRRKVLDWRDDSILKLSQAGEMACKDFCVHIEVLVDSVPLWRRAVPQSSDEVLKDDFDKLVRMEIARQAAEVSNQLRILLTAFKDKSLEPLRLFDECPDSQLKCISEIGFKPSRQDDICDSIAKLVHGSGGVVDSFHQQIFIASDETIRKVLS